MESHRKHNQNRRSNFKTTQTMPQRSAKKQKSVGLTFLNLFADDLFWNVWFWQFNSGGVLLTVGTMRDRAINGYVVYCERVAASRTDAPTPRRSRGGFLSFGIHGSPRRRYTCAARTLFLFFVRDCNSVFNCDVLRWLPTMEK